MASPEPLVHFYDLSGPNCWSPACWCTRYALNFKGIPYKTIKLSYPDIKPTCEKLLGDMTGLEATVPIIEILGPNYKALNDSKPIARLLNERFTEEMGYKHLKDIDFKFDWYTGKFVFPWILNDVYNNALDPKDGSKEYFKRTREEDLKCNLTEVEEKYGNGEKAILEGLEKEWAGLRERMNKIDETTEPTYIDFVDASKVKWVEGSSPEKYQKLMRLYGDDTLPKLMKLVEPYSADI